jgi:uncharacterized protein
LSVVDQLWDLQTVLSALNERERLMDVKPESFAAIDRDYEAAREEMTRLQEQLETLARERRRVDGELTDQQELLKKYQGQLMQVKNQQQYAAAWKEIDAARKHVKELEESELKNMTDSEALQSQLETRRGGFDELEAKHNEAHGEWQHSLADLRKEAEQLRGRADALGAALPEKVRKQFDRIYKQRQQVAVALVASDTCSSCHTRLRPAVAQQLRRGELVYCEGCHRILYLEKGAS